ncbi:hypothetical protein HZF02_26665 [Pseudomonas yamanorum]|nr:hypothetical protein HZF02_26665 [Pseudomonas yamanorum]
MTVLLAFFLASLLDPFALIICLGLGFFLKSYWKGAVAGAIAYLLLILVIPGIRIYALVVVSKLLAGALLGLIGTGLGKWVRTDKKPKPEHPES